MIRDLFSHRGIQVALIFVCLFVSGSLLYNWHVKRTTDAARADNDALLRHLDQSHKTRTASDLATETEAHQVAIPTEMNDTSRVAEETGMLLGEKRTAPMDLGSADTFVLPQSEAGSETPNEFPEVPSDFPDNLTPVWVTLRNYQKGDMHDHEMMYRVLIKLWNQGERGFVNGVFRDNNRRVYPLYPDTLYVRWKAEEIGTGEWKRTVLTPGVMLGTHDHGFTTMEMLSGELEALYPNIKFVDIDTAGYDPETFLTDSEK